MSNKQIAIHLPKPDAVQSLFANEKAIINQDYTVSQLAHDVETTLVFGCLLVATSDNVGAMLSQRYLSDVVAPTKI